MSRIDREKQTINAMLDIFCRAQHRTSEPLCEDCRTLLDYARQRLDICPFAADKPACNKCTVHCYSATMRERVREVMRYAGPRMVWRHPLLALRHLIDLTGDSPVLPRKRPGK